MALQISITLLTQVNVRRTTPLTNNKHENVTSRAHKNVLKGQPTLQPAKPSQLFWLISADQGLR